MVSNFRLDLPDVLIDGSTMFDDFGTTGTGSCYLGVFPNIGSAEEAKTIYTGVSFLKKFYTYFDMTECATGGKCEHLSVTAGVRNQSANILQAQYDDGASFYNERAGDQSIWSRYPN